MILLYLKYAVAVISLGLGIYMAIRPNAIRGFTGVTSDGPRGVTEIRSAFAGAFVGTGVAPLLFPIYEVFAVLGIMYAAIALLRLIGIIVDKSGDQSNWISLASEVVFAVLLLLPG